MESQSLKAFRRKMVNPIHWREANRIFVKYTKSDATSIDGAARIIKDLASTLKVSLSEQEVHQAAKWLVQQDIDPQSRKDRFGLWHKVK